MTPNLQPVTLPNSHVHILQSSSSGHEYQISVGLPASYTSSDQHYPVLYLLDGNWLFPMALSIVRMMYFTPDFCDIPEIIIVGIGYNTDSLAELMALRSRDYTPTEHLPSVQAGRDDLPWAVIDDHSGQAAQFRHFITTELFPFIDGNYRTDPQNRIGHGDSFGGLFMLHTLFQQPDTFHRYLIISPSIWWHDKVILSQEKTYADDHADLAAQVFLASGDLELVVLTDVAQLLTNLQSREYPSLNLSYAVMNNETHLSIMAHGIATGLRTVLGG